MFAQSLLLGAALTVGAYAGSSSGGAFGGLSSKNIGGFGSTSAPASSVSAQTTAGLVVASLAGDNQQLVGSIVGADACETTYALHCTGGGLQLEGSQIPCNPDIVLQATYGASYWGLSTSLNDGGVVVTASASCDLDGPSKAVCTEAVYASADGKHTASTVTTTVTALSTMQVPITAGAAKLPAATGKCTSSPNAAPIGAVDIYKVLVVPGAAALLAGAGAFA